MIQQIQPYIESVKQIDYNYYYNSAYWYYGKLRCIFAQSDEAEIDFQRQLLSARRN